MTQILVEPFAEFASGRGVPTLCRYGNAHLYWHGDGLWSIDEYYQFESIIERGTMNDMLLSVFKRYRPQRAELSYGGMSGYLIGAPLPIVIETMTVVREHFAAALRELRKE